MRAQLLHPPRGGGRVKAMKSLRARISAWICLVDFKAVLTFRGLQADGRDGVSTYGV